MDGKVPWELDVIREMHLIDPTNNVSLVQYIPGQHVLVQSDADAQRLVDGGYCAWQGPHTSTNG
jgi:hypothetical protein